MSAASTCSACGEVATCLIGPTPFCGGCWAARRAPWIARYGGSNVGRGVAERPWVAEDYRVVCGRCGAAARMGTCGRCGEPDCGGALVLDSTLVPGVAWMGEYHLACDLCDATWVGMPGDPCDWCRRAAADRKRWQGELVLELPDVDPDDATFDKVMLAWRGRLQRAVTAGLVPREQAARVWKRMRQGAERAA